MNALTSIVNTSSSSNTYYQERICQNWIQPFEYKYLFWYPNSEAQHPLAGGVVNLLLPFWQCLFSLNLKLIINRSITLPVFASKRAEPDLYEHIWFSRIRSLTC